MDADNIVLLKKELTADEGNKKCPYLDSQDFWTIGIGHFIGKHRGGWACISADQVNKLFEEDVADVISELDKHLPWWREMSPIRQRVIANMMFNMGWPTLKQFKNTLRYMSQGKYDLAATGMCKSLWATQVGDRASRLAHMMRADAMPPRNGVYKRCKP